MVTDDATRNFETVALTEGVLDLIYCSFDRIGANGTLCAGSLDAGPQLLPIEGLPAAIFLHNDKRGNLRSLIGSEAAITLLALTATPRHRDFISVALIKHARIT